MRRAESPPAESALRITRRRFVESAAGGVVLASGSTLLTGCHGVRREDTEGGDAPPGLTEDERTILHLASLAPSGHNTQPWKVQVRAPGRWLIAADRERLLPAVDPARRETVLSVGAFLENLIIAAGHHGLDAQLEVGARSTDEAELATLVLVKGPRLPADLDSLRHRRVVRMGLLGRELRADDLRYLTQPASAHCHFFTAGSPQGRYLSEGTLEANRAQAARDPAQEELADWIRWSDADARAHRDGLTAESMEIGGIAGWYVRHFYDHVDATSRDFRDRTVEMVAEQVTQLGGWLVLTGDGDSAAALLETGRVFERVFLRARARMIAIHPMTQMLEEAGWQAQVAMELGLSSPVQFILRVGYVEEYPEPVSLRRPLKEFVRA